MSTTKLWNYGILLSDGKWAKLYGQTFTTHNKALAEALLLHNQISASDPRVFIGARVVRRLNEIGS